MPISATDRTPSPASYAYHRTSSLYDIDRRTNAYISDRPHAVARVLRIPQNVIFIRHRSSYECLYQRPTASDARATLARARRSTRSRDRRRVDRARRSNLDARVARARARSRVDRRARVARAAHDDVDDDDDDDDDARGATRRETRARERRARATRARARRRRRRGASAARDAGWRLRRGTRGEDR